MPTQKLSTYSIKLKEEANWNDIVDAIISVNTEKSYCMINEQGDSYIGGCYIFESLQNQTVYNIEENKFEIVTIPKQNVVKFDAFLNNNTLFLWGSKKAATLFITTMEQASRHTIIVEQNSADLKLMLSRLMKDASVSYSKMKIVDIVIEDGILANCSVNLANQENALDLIKKYVDSIAQITVNIGKQAQPISITLYSSGSVVVFKDRDDIDDEVMNSINLMIGGAQ